MLEKRNTKMPKGVVIGTAKDECLKLFEGSSGEVVIVSQDSDYFSLGKSVRDAFINVGVKVSTIVFDDEFMPDVEHCGKLLAFPQSTALVVAVGKAKVINISRYFSAIFKTPLVAIPTDVCFSSEFSDKTILLQNNVPKLLPCDKPKAVVIDLVFMAGLKKQAFADAYCEISAKLLSLIDFETQAVINDDFTDRTAQRAFEVIKSLTQIDCEGSPCHVKIINAQLRLALLSQKNSNWLFGSEYFVAYTLTAMKNGSLTENGFSVIRPIIKLYEAFLLCDMFKAEVVPNYNARIEQLSRIINASELELIDNYKPMDLKSIVEARKKLVDDRIIVFIKKCGELLSGLENAYKFVYKGKQKRADIESKDLRRALELAPYLCKDGLLKIINDSGVCECFG